MSDVTRQQLLDELDGLEELRLAAAMNLGRAESARSEAVSSLGSADVHLTAAERNLDGALAKINDIRAVIESLPDNPTLPAPTPTPTRKMLYGQQYESLWGADRNGKPTDLLDFQRARAWRELLAADMVRYTVDLSLVLTDHGRAKAKHDLAGFANARIPFVLADCRYLPREVMIVEEGQYPEQCRICAHPPHASGFCPMCNDTKAGRLPMPELWKQVGKVIRPEHKYVKADPRTVNMEGYSWTIDTHGGCISPVDWNSDQVKGPHGASWYFDTMLAYVKDPPHSDPNRVEELSFQTFKIIGKGVKAASGKNEPGQRRYNVKSGKHEEAWSRGDREEYDRLHALMVEETYAEVIDPFFAGMRRAAPHVVHAGPEADTDVIFNAFRRDFEKRSLHIYDWTYGPMMNLVRAWPADAPLLWVTESNDPDGDKPRLDVADLYRELYETERVEGMIVHGDEQLLQRDENAPFGYVLTDVGRKLMAIRG